MKTSLRAGRRWIWHVLYWLGAALFLSFFYGYRMSGFQITLWYVILLLPVSIFTAYFFNYYLIPRYLIKRRFVLFSLYTLYTLILSVYLEFIVLIFIFIVITGLDFGAGHFEPLFLLSGMYIPVLMAVAARLYNEWSKSEEERRLISQQKAEAELMFLKSQLHPHFLFNTLNNLYALALERSAKVPALILKLSDLLHFILYDSGSDKISLNKELEQVHNYLELEKLRLGNHEDISLEVEGETTDATILPLSILTLAENAFKHGIQKSNNQAWLKIRVLVEEGKVAIAVSNNYAKSRAKEAGEGIGLVNLKSRLQLLYRDQFSLRISEEENEYKVLLRLG